MESSKEIKGIESNQKFTNLKAIRDTEDKQDITNLKEKKEKSLIKTIVSTLIPLCLIGTLEKYFDLELVYFKSIYSVLNNESTSYLDRIDGLIRGPGSILVLSVLSYSVLRKYKLIAVTEFLCTVYYLFLELSLVVFVKVILPTIRSSYSLNTNRELFTADLRKLQLSKFNNNLLVGYVGFLILCFRIGKVLTDVNQTTAVRKEEVVKEEEIKKSIEIGNLATEKNDNTKALLKAEVSLYSRVFTRASQVVLMFLSLLITPSWIVLAIAYVARTYPAHSNWVVLSSALQLFTAKELYSLCILSFFYRVVFLILFPYLYGTWSDRFFKVNHYDYQILEEKENIFSTIKAILRKMSLFRVFTNLKAYLKKTDEEEKKKSKIEFLESILLIALVINLNMHDVWAAYFYSAIEGIRVSAVSDAKNKHTTLAKIFSLENVGIIFSNWNLGIIAIVSAVVLGFKVFNDKLKNKKRLVVVYNYVFLLGICLCNFTLGLIPKEYVKYIVIIENFYVFLNLCLRMNYYKYYIKSYFSSKVGELIINFKLLIYIFAEIVKQSLTSSLKLSPVSRLWLITGMWSLVSFISYSTMGALASTNTDRDYIKEPITV